MNPDFAAYPLWQAIKERRSRRFCRGMSNPEGPLAYTSAKTPLPLSENEESLLAYAACGITGPALADLPFGATSGSNIMAGLLGRTVASGDAIHTASLITVNDSGAFIYRRPQDIDGKQLHEFMPSDDSQIVDVMRRSRVQICSERPKIPSEPLFNLNLNRWSSHAQGTTYFLPVSELTFLYINGLLEVLNEHSGAFIVDERAGFRPAGLAKFARSKGGHLDDDPRNLRVVTIATVERLVIEFVTIEQGMMLQNLALAAQSLGLGGFPNFANHDFAWFKGLGFRLNEMPASVLLGMKWIPRLALKLTGRDTNIPLPIGLERNGETLLRAWTPPYFKSMRDAVEAVVSHKINVFRWGSAVPWKDSTVGKCVAPVSGNAIEATVAYCEYVWKTYGRFPSTVPAFRTVLGFRAGHLDLAFYDRFYPPSAISESIRKDADSLSRS